MDIININNLPYSECGDNPKRIIKLVISPYTTGENRLAIVHVSVPPGGISEGHIHDESDELIYFNNEGKVVLDGVEYVIEKCSIVIAKRGVKHECINTSICEELTLLCIFIPPIKPYGVYPKLIELTKKFFMKSQQT